MPKKEIITSKDIPASSALLSQGTRFGNLN